MDEERKNRGAKERQGERTNGREGSQKRAARPTRAQPIDPQGCTFREATHMRKPTAFPPRPRYFSFLTFFPFGLSSTSLSSSDDASDSSPSPCPAGAGVPLPTLGGASSGSGEDDRSDDDEPSDASDAARERFLWGCLTVWAGTDAARGANGSSRSEPVSEIIELAIVRLDKGGRR